ncbi:MAG: branched-chain amino acid aminotransferase [Saprospiraceae bacterium]|jgi:branched-chain amino acid aminotransferase
MLKTAFFNDSFVDLDKLYIHGTDLGLHRGYGIFDFFKIRNRSNPWIDWYFERLFNSLSQTRLSVSFDQEGLLDIMDELLTRNEVVDAYLKIVVTAGYSSNGYTRSHNDNMMIYAMPLPQADINSVATSVLITDEYRRDIPLVKTTNYMRSCILQPEMKAADAIDVLFHKESEISEASRSNIFVIKDGKVCTPDKHILHGITRRRVLSVENSNIDIEERTISLDETMAADEVFITSSTKGIMPITAIDGKQIGNGKTGPISKTLMSSINNF